MEQNLVFLISTPRAGSTMLMRILNATSSIVSETGAPFDASTGTPWLLETVEKAPFDQLQAQMAMRELVKAFPNQDADYYEVCRAYCDSALRKDVRHHQARRQHRHSILLGQNASERTCTALSHKGLSKCKVHLF